jgi:hypothetical protein
MSSTNRELIKLNLTKESYGGGNTSENKLRLWSSLDKSHQSLSLGRKENRRYFEENDDEDSSMDEADATNDILDEKVQRHALTNGSHIMHSQSTAAGTNPMVGESLTQKVGVSFNPNKMFKDFLSQSDLEQMPTFSHKHTMSNTGNVQTDKRLTLNL